MYHDAVIDTLTNQILMLHELLLSHDIATTLLLLLNDHLQTNNVIHEQILIHLRMMCFLLVLLHDLRVLLLVLSPRQRDQMYQFKNFNLLHQALLPISKMDLILLLSNQPTRCDTGFVLPTQDDQQRML